MKYSEELFWILDKVGVKLNTLEIQNKKFQENIDFVHSLGLKCDCVGWCKLNLSNPRTPEILNRISEFCKENGWRARGLYDRQYIDVTSNWFELVPTDFKNNTLCDRIETVTEKSKKIHTSVIRAFHELSPTPKMYGDEIYVPERFRNYCIKNNINDLDFCWVKDKGKYDAEQYFHVYGKHLIPQIAVDFDINKSNKDLIHAAGGWLPEIAKIFYELQQINLQDCYLLTDLPTSGIAYTYIPPTFSCVGRHSILIHKDIAEDLINHKIMSASTLRPVPVVKTLPGGYTLKRTQSMERPATHFMERMLSEYEKLKQTPRPVRMVSEKDALKILRLAKKDRKDDFKKALVKAKSQVLLDTDYNVMIPYYAIANGGFLSDEYELLSFTQAIKENEEFQKDLQKEELLDIKPQGIVIAKCPDGDVILLCSNGEVVRFSHEAPEITEQWPSLPQFFVDAINE